MTMTPGLEGRPVREAPSAALGPLAGMASQMQAEAEAARGEAERAERWREQMLAGQLLTVKLLERLVDAAEASAAAVVSLEARAEAFGTGGLAGAFLGRSQPKRPTPPHAR